MSGRQEQRTQDATAESTGAEDAGEQQPSPEQQWPAEQQQLVEEHAQEPNPSAGAKEPTRDALSTEPEDESSPPPRGGGRLLGRSLGLLVVLFLAFSCWQSWQAHSDDDLGYAAARDTVRERASAHLETLNSASRSHLRADLKGWRAVATGPLREELRRTQGKDAVALAKSGTTARAKVTDAAVTALDTRTGTARVLATVRIEVGDRDASPTTDRKRLAAGLSRTPEGWKVRTVRAVQTEDNGEGESEDGSAAELKGGDR